MSSVVTKCPDPGIYENIPAEDYFAWDAVSNSKLSLLKRSPKHYQHGFAESTPAMQLGSLVHSGVLEPLAIAKRYVFMPDYSSHPDNVTGKGERSFSSATTFVKSMQDQFRRLHHDKEIVTEEQYNTMVGMATALAENEKAKHLLRDGKSEVSVVWDDPDTGLRCKARADWLKPGIMADLKTTMDAAEFERSIVKFGYHRQMAFYARGLRANGIDAEPWIICVEKSAPYGCRCAPMDLKSLHIGAAEIDELLSVLVECRQRNYWPGYENPESWGCPDWYLNRAEGNDSETVTSWFESTVSQLQSA
jgi:hypothetical protein